MRLTANIADPRPTEKRVNSHYIYTEHESFNSFKACKSIHEWRELLRELASKAPTRFSALRVPCGGARGGGLLSWGFSLPPFSFPAPDDPSSGPSRAPVQELLPLPPAAAARHPQSLRQDITEYSLGLTAESLCNSAGHCLKFFNCAGWTSKPILLRNNLSLNKFQEMSLNHLWDSILQFLEFANEEFSLEKISDELNSKVTSYGGVIVSVRRSNLRSCSTSLAEAGRGVCSTC